MAFEPGDVAFLKSGGRAMTVAAIEEDSVECLWLGEEGELFRETIPSVALTVVLETDDEDDSDDEDEDSDREDEDHEETDADEAKLAKRKRKTA